MESRPSSVISHAIKTIYDSQWNIFQIPMPRDADRIIGVEYGFHSTLNDMLSPPVRTDRVGGRLILETATSIFYDQYLMVEESKSSMSELGYTCWVPGFRLPTNYIRERDFHSTCREPDSIDVKSSGIVYGSYQDQWGVQQSRSMIYTFSVYLWYTLVNFDV